MLILPLAGCEPEEHWLDDSSGFVYRFQKDESSVEIRFYDVAKKAERVVWSGSIRAGCDLDFAAGRLFVLETGNAPLEDLSTCGLTMYDLKSSQVHRSARRMRLPAQLGKDRAIRLAKFPKRGSRLLVQFETANGDLGNAILNAEAESLTQVSDRLIEFASDGTGFVAANRSASDSWQSSLRARKKLDSAAIEKLCASAISFVDLDGVSHPIAWDQSAVRRVIALYDEQLRVATAKPDPVHENYCDVVTMSSSIWAPDPKFKERPEAAPHLMIANVGDVGVLIDVDRRTVTEPAAPLLTELKEARDSARSTYEMLDAARGVKLKNAVVRSSVLESPTRNRPYYINQLDARRNLDGKTTTILDRVEADTTIFCNKTSPDGRYAVFQYQEPRKDRDEKLRRIHYVVVDQFGSIVDRLFFEHFDDSSFKVEPFVSDEADADGR